MKTFREYRESNWGYSQHLDGPPLKPKTIAGAEQQIYKLAEEIRNTFGIDEKWARHKDQIFRATIMMDEAAELLGQGMNAEERNDEHRWNT